MPTDRFDGRGGGGIPEVSSPLGVDDSSFTINTQQHSNSDSVPNQSTFIAALRRGLPTLATNDAPAATPASNIPTTLSVPPAPNISHFAMGVPTQSRRRLSILTKSSVEVRHAKIGLRLARNLKLSRGGFVGSSLVSRILRRKFNQPMRSFVMAFVELIQIKRTTLFRLLFSVLMTRLQLRPRWNSVK